MEQTGQAATTVEELRAALAFVSDEGKSAEAGVQVDLPRANSQMMLDEVKDLRLEARTLKEVVAEQALELRLLKKSMIADGDDRT